MTETTSSQDLAATIERLKAREQTVRGLLDGARAALNTEYLERTEAGDDPPAAVTQAQSNLERWRLELESVTSSINAAEQRHRQALQAEITDTALEIQEGLEQFCAEREAVAARMESTLDDLAGMMRELHEAGLRVTRASKLIIGDVPRLERAASFAAVVQLVSEQLLVLTVKRETEGAGKPAPIVGEIAEQNRQAVRSFRRVVGLPVEPEPPPLPAREPFPTAADFARERLGDRYTGVTSRPLPAGVTPHPNIPLHTP